MRTSSNLLFFFHSLDKNHQSRANNMVKFFLSFFLLISLTLTLALPQGELSPKIKEALRTSLRANSNVNIFVGMKGGSTTLVLNQVTETLNAQSMFSLVTHSQRTTAVHSALVAHAETFQKPILNFLHANYPTVEVQSFWIINKIFVKNVDASVVSALAALDQVSEIQEEQVTHIRNVYDGPTGPSVEGRGTRDNGVFAEWGIENMQVPAVWNLGYNGTGLIIGNIDTGVRGTHELLRNKWVTNQNNGWLDPYMRREAPYDVYNHGTHTMGTLVGDDGMGVAPGARWLACKGYRDNGSGYESEFIACLQYMLCPTNYQGNNPDCTKAPHVVSNSWGWTGGASQFNPAIYAWNTAGILSSFSAGNTGPSCSSIYSPADQPQVLAVGATNNVNVLAGFSSLGPSPTSQLKPEISAPGVGVRSASSASDTAYMNASGTSMSCPHATGVLALLKSADGNMSQASAVMILENTGSQPVPSTSRICGGISESIYPNNHIGRGKIDALAAIQMLKSMK